jgi:Tol biopolymer transport system component
VLRSRIGGALLVAALALVPAAGARAAVTELASVASDGTHADGGSGDPPAISADGRYVAFVSGATNLVPGDTNRKLDVFVRDRRTRRTERVSLASDGTQADKNSSFPSISADGRYVAFTSLATNLVPGDTNGAVDVFVYDRQTDVIQRVSVSGAGTQANAGSLAPAISADGHFVSFDSDATNLVPGDTNGRTDIFVHDLLTGATQRVSVSSAGNQGANTSFNSSISGDGRYVAFSSLAGNLVPGDTNGVLDVFIHDRQTGATQRVSVSGTGAQGDQLSGDPAVSADGTSVAFLSGATNLVPGDTNGAFDIFVHDLAGGVTERVSVAGDGTQADQDSPKPPSISADGRYVAFISAATNLVPGDTNGAWDAFVHDRQTGATDRVSVAGDTGAQANGPSSWATVSGSGHDVAFNSSATNLTHQDHNFSADTFVRDFDRGL